MSIAGYIMDMYQNPGKYRKFWVGAGGFIVTLVSTYFPDAPWVPPLISALTAAGVWTVPNAKGKQ